MYIPIGTIALVLFAAWLLNSWQGVSARQKAAVKEKNRLISEAEKVINSTSSLSWTEMTAKQREVHECAAERLRTLKSYKKNHAPDSYPFMKEWPLWFTPRE
jgi:hypothetical protein